MTLIIFHYYKPQPYINIYFKQQNLSIWFNFQFLAYSHGNWSVPKMLHQFICSQEQIDLTVDGIVYKPQKSDRSGNFLFCCDWQLVPKLTVIGAFNRKLINYLGNHKIFKYFNKWIGACWQMNWYNILGTLQLPRL